MLVVQRCSIRSQRQGTDLLNEPYIFLLEGDALSMNGRFKGLLKKSDEESLTGLLYGHTGCFLHLGCRLQLLLGPLPLIECDLPDEPLKWELDLQQISRLLLLPDFPEGQCPRSSPLDLLHSDGGWLWRRKHSLWIYIRVWGRPGLLVFGFPFAGGASTFAPGLLVSVLGPGPGPASDSA